MNAAGLTISDWIWGLEIERNSGLVLLRGTREESTNITLINRHTIKPLSKYIISLPIDKCSFSLENLLYVVDSSQKRD